MSALPQVTETAEPLTSARFPFLLFFDGECAFCDRWVDRVKGADEGRRVRFATKQGLTFQRAAREHPEIAKVDSIVLVARREDGGENFLVRSEAIHRLIEGLPRFRFLAGLLDVMPVWLSNIGYNIFAKLRTPIFGRLDQCRIPSPEDRELYLD